MKLRIITLNYSKEVQLYNSLVNSELTGLVFNKEPIIITKNSGIHTKDSSINNTLGILSGTYFNNEYYVLKEENSKINLSKLDGNSITSFENNSLRGLAYFKDELIYLYFENKLIRYSIKYNRKIEEKELRFPNKIDSIYYAGDHFWLLERGINGTGDKLHVYDVSLTAVQTLNLSSLSISSAKALCVDWENKKLYIGCESSEGILVFELDINYYTKEPKDFYYIKNQIQKIIYKGKTIWNKIKGCFSTGFWIKDNEWDKNQLWNNGKN